MRLVAMYMSSIGVDRASPHVARRSNRLVVQRSDIMKSMKVHSVSVQSLQFGSRDIRTVARVFRAGFGDWQ
jgi:hypothetical protein